MRKILMTFMALGLFTVLPTFAQTAESMVVKANTPQVELPTTQVEVAPVVTPTVAETTFTCPYGNVDCINNGSCINHVQGQYNENCPNNGVPKRDGSGYQNNGQGHGQHRGNHHN